MFCRLELLGIRQFSAQFGGGVEENGKTLRAKEDLLAAILQCNQRGFLFGAVAVKTIFHNYSKFKTLSPSPRFYEVL